MRAIVLVLLLGGCTMVVGDAQRLAYEDGVRYIEENHQVRRDYRAAKEALVAAMVSHYQRCIAIHLEGNDTGKAEGCFDRGMRLLDDHYRDLATIEALRAGIDDFGEFKSQVEMMEPE